MIEQTMLSFSLLIVWKKLTDNHLLFTVVIISTIISLSLIFILQRSQEQNLMTRTIGNYIRVKLMKFIPLNCIHIRIIVLNMTLFRSFFCWGTVFPIGYDRITPWWPLNF